jgi:hypothetical protein
MLDNLPFCQHAHPSSRCTFRKVLLSCHEWGKKEGNVEISISPWALTGEGTTRKTPKPETMQEGTVRQRNCSQPVFVYGLNKHMPHSSQNVLCRAECPNSIAAFSTVKRVHFGCVWNVSAKPLPLNALAIYLVGILDMRGSCISRDCLSILEPGEIECKSSKVGPTR